MPTSSNQAALAFQIAFDLYNNATQQFLAIVKAQISDLKLPSTAEDGDSEPSTADVEVKQTSSASVKLVCLPLRVCPTLGSESRRAAR